jgi:hypothetical protein
MEPSTLAVLNFIVQLIVSGVIGITASYIFIILAFVACTAFIERTANDGLEIIAVWLPMMLYTLMPIIWLVGTYLAWTIIF